MISRRSLLLAAPALALASRAQASPFPDRPIRMIVPYQAGQGADISARRFADRLRVHLNQTIVIDNRPGAGGNLGAVAVAKARPDGYTILWGSNATHVANQFLYDQLPFDPVADFAPIVLAAKSSMVLSAGVAFGGASVMDLVALAKAKPGTVDVAIPSTTSRVIHEMMVQAAGIDLVPVPYRGSPNAQMDVIGGRVPVIIDTTTATIPRLTSGELKALAVTTGRRFPTLPQVPTLAEAGLPGIDVGPWNAVWAPAGTPSGIVAALNAASNKVLEEAEMRQGLLEGGAEAMGGSPTDVSRLMETERERWGAIIREAGLKAAD